ncbi:PQQ-binding-like beta-propeller repeat protein [Nocardia sp. NPDC058705]|uniref:outer membrane protein assembly factor BamB family protein n=1 Tax=Nocardia sp. NPDC058705 TaxID=3346609 RepID=UPI003694BD55
MNKPAVWTIDGEVGAEEIAVVGEMVLVPLETSLVAVDRVTGQQRWRRDQKIADGGWFRYRIRGELIVLYEGRAASDDPILVEVIEAATGRTRWQGSSHRVNVYGDAVYQTDCTGLGTRDVQCTTMRRAIGDGKPTWPHPATGTLGDDVIGNWHQLAPPESEYLPVWLGPSTPVPSDRPWGLVATATGNVLPGRGPSHAWYAFSAGDLLVITNHDRDEYRCEIGLEAISGPTGTRQWEKPVHAGRYKDKDACRKRLSGSEQSQMIGSGSRIAAVTADRTPQLFDLATGSTVWAAAERGSPIDGDERSLLVGEFADQGALSLLDLETGAKKWSIPDPGFSPHPSERNTFLVGDRVVVGATIRMGNSGGPAVIVYDRETGREVDRYVGYLQGAGADWVAVLVTEYGKPDTIQFHG